ncbi:uncharacterized protein B0J16DRAFT_329723 [Fusarium flagelliforme]|uniref:uncharacterized protein n=1 Tax=Fusarium flagelliforme TaxID=2675880 RepID=UPI001E8DA9F0|nr:uncharacterized protein B0J16DRAFT_329723 [Fusarium flagelliforme]KAH7198065.1 hypothetical protein B0J16DRAFT_329723 [Fusarium flagelliforme]
MLRSSSPSQGFLVLSFAFAAIARLRSFTTCFSTGICQAILVNQILLCISAHFQFTSRHFLQQTQTRQDKTRQPYLGSIGLKPRTKSLGSFLSSCVLSSSTVGHWRVTE